LELAVVFPAVMVLVFLIVQAGIYFHARTLAITAAQEGLRAASTLTGTANQGTTKATSFLDRTADGWVVDREVAAQRTPTTATVIVTGRSISLIPGMPGMPITQKATGPIERPTG
jgi:Flp pilus assembly protein TadG